MLLQFFLSAASAANYCGSWFVAKCCDHSFAHACYTLGSMPMEHGSCIVMRSTFEVSADFLFSGREITMKAHQ